MLRNVIVSGYVTFHQINKFFVNILVFSINKMNYLKYITGCP